jgi:cell division protein FtsB
MKLSSDHIRHLLYQHSQAFVCLLLFFTCAFVYLANSHDITSNDNVPNTLLAFNWLENHTLNFDAFRGGYFYGPTDMFGANGIPYFFAEAPNGHLTSAYPIGVAIVSFPLYVVFFLYLKLSALIQSGFSNPSALALNIATDASFNDQRFVFEKLAGVLLTSLSVVIFFLSVRLKFSYAVALVATFSYAFASSNWVVSSQGLWQHTVGNLVIASILLCLFKVNRLEGTRRNYLLVVAGILTGFLPDIRPTHWLFLVTIVIYSIVTYRKATLFLLIGSASALLNMAWNTYYFGFSLRSLIAGGYSKLLGTSSGSYVFDVNYTWQAFWGLLISPSRGLLIYMPILLFIVPGLYYVFKHRSKPDERLLLYFSIASLVLFIHYCVYLPWWGAITYGTRFFIDVLPIVCYLLCYFLDRQFQLLSQRKQRFTGLLVVFLACLVFSTFTQAVGAFSAPHIWDTSPTPHHTRFWDWKDSQIERHTRNLYQKIVKPIPAPKKYRQHLKGTIKQIKDKQGHPIETGITATPLQEMTLQATVKNMGRSPWYGYDTGLLRGRIVVKVHFLNAAGQDVPLVFPNLLYVKGTPDQGETAKAIGYIQFPEEPGEYKMVFSLAAEQMGDFRGRPGQSAYELTARVTPPTAAKP